MASKRQHDGLENHVMNKRLRLSKKTKNISRASRSKPNRPVRRRPAGQAVNVHGDDEDTLVDMFDRSNFAQNKTIAANLQRSDLNNPIWSGFRQTHFPNYVNYAALQPSLRLATKLLRSPVLEPFLLTILNHKKLTTVVSEPPGKAYSRLDSQMRMLAQGRGLVNKRAAIDRAFRELALLVRFGFTQRVEIGASTRANTRLDPGQFTGGVGTHTTTSYSRGSYDRLVRLHGQNTQDLAELTWETFSAGVTFAHVSRNLIIFWLGRNTDYVI